MTKHRIIALLVCFIYLLGIPAQAAIYGLTPPTQLVPISHIQSYPVLRGIEVDPQDPFHLKFIVDTGDINADVGAEDLRPVVVKLIKYFLAGLTMPESDLWVNLSPYEQNNIISDKLSHTDLGKQLLAQDYTLKQLTSSLTYPDSKIGKKYWAKVYKEVYQFASTTNIPINTYNKVWIVPKKAEIYEHNNSAFITEASLSVLHEQDYLALKQNAIAVGAVREPPLHNQTIHKTASQVMKELILPHIEKDINSGENFAKLRQIYHSLILSTWFKQKLKDSIYKYYLNQQKIQGIDLEDKQAKGKIYSLYLEAFKKGVFNYIKTDKEPYTNRPIKRQYISGGMQLALAPNLTYANQMSSSALVSANQLKGFGLTLSNNPRVSPSIALTRKLEELARAIREPQEAHHPNDTVEIRERIIRLQNDIRELEEDEENGQASSAVGDGIDLKLKEKEAELKALVKQLREPVFSDKYLISLDIGGLRREIKTLKLKKKARDSVLEALAKEGAVREEPVSGVSMRGITSKADDDSDIIRRCIMQHLRNTISSVGSKQSRETFVTREGLIASRIRANMPIHVMINRVLEQIDKDKVLAIAKIKGKGSSGYSIWLFEAASSAGASSASAPGGIDLEAIGQSVSSAAGNFRFHNLTPATIHKFQTCQGLFIIDVVKTSDRVDLKRELGLK